MQILKRMEKTMTYEDRLEQEGYPLFEPAKGNRPFESGVRTGNLIFISGNAARIGGYLKYTGIVGDSISMEQTRDAAILCFINCLASVRTMIGSLDQLERIVNIKGYVACTPQFVAQPEVMNAVSDLANKVFGDVGRHSRVTMGAVSLPGGTPVEVEIVVQVK
jgi:enamine deaminase RidA (YjgF/YER057c/UK114 family)